MHRLFGKQTKQDTEQNGKEEEEMSDAAEEDPSQSEELRTFKTKKIESGQRDSNKVNAPFYSDQWGEGVGSFELAPKNEMRVSVMGEITTAHGFDVSRLNIYYLVDLPKGWRNDSVFNNVEGITRSCCTNDQNVAHFSHEFSFHLMFSMDVLEKSDSFPTPIISLLAVSMDTPTPRIVYNGYGYTHVPMTPGTHFTTIKMWKPSPRTILEKLQSAFLDASPSLQNIKFVHMTSSEAEPGSNSNLLRLQTEGTGTVKLRFNIIHQMPITSVQGTNAKLDLLEKMSSTTILNSVQAVIEAFHRARQKAVSLQDQYH